MKPINQRLTVLVIGLIIGTLSLEISLRIFGSFYSKRLTFEAKNYQGTYKILCLGDSFTEGFGADKTKTYPSQLGALLNSHSGRKKFVVINGGISTINSSMVLKDLPGNLENIKPDMVILLIGGANTWNYWGYLSYLKGETFSSSLYNLLYRIRIYKLIKLMSNAIKDKITAPEKEITSGTHNPGVNQKDYFRNEDSRYKRLDSKTKPRHDSHFGTAAAYRSGDDPIDRYRQGIKASPTDGMNYYSIGETYRTQRDYAEAAYWYRQGIKASPADGMNYYGIGETYRAQRDYPQAIDWYRQGIKANSKNDNNYYGIGQAYAALRDYPQAIDWYKQGIKIYPGDGSSYYGLGEIYEFLKDYCQAAHWYMQGIKANPNYQDNYRGIVLIYRHLRTEEKQELMRTLAELARDNPTALNYAQMLKKENSVEEIGYWLKSEIREIAEICRKEDKKIIVLDYPIDNGVNRFIKEAAEEYSIPFVDNFRVFNEILNRGERKENLFVPDKHCNDKGYGIMARNVYNKIKEDKMLDLD